MANNFEYNDLSSTTKDNSRKILFVTKIIDKNANIWRQKKAPITKIRSAVRFFGTFQGKKLFISN
jgi:hypothetical protein